MAQRKRKRKTFCPQGLRLAPVFYDSSISNLYSVSTRSAPGGVLLYLDEIQYFNKKQQQSLLEFMENGSITLIASTTENPYFYVYRGDPWASLLLFSAYLPFSLCTKKKEAKKKNFQRRLHRRGQEAGVPCGVGAALPEEGL